MVTECLLCILQMVNMDYAKQGLYRFGDLEQWNKLEWNGGMDWN